MKCGATILKSPVDIKIENGKYIIEVYGKCITQHININPDTISIKSLETLKGFIADVYKIGYNDACDFLMNKKIL